MSLQRETVRAYRKLYRNIQEVGYQCGLPNRDGLAAYVSHKFHLACDTHRQQLMGILSENVNLAQYKKKNLRKKELNNRIHKFERYLSAAVDHAKMISEAVCSAPGNAQLTSLLQVLGAGIGSTAYQAHLESNFLALAHHNARKEDREELTEKDTGERKNRILQQATLPFAEKLLLAHRVGLCDYFRKHQGDASHLCAVTETGLSPLTKWQMVEAMVGTRVGVSAHHVKLLGDDEAVVEIDETYNRQTIYVVCHRHASSLRDTSVGRVGVETPSLLANEGGFENPSASSTNWNVGGDMVLSTDGFAWDEEMERVDIAETEEVRRTVFSSAFLSRAMRLCGALESETPLHRSRKTVVVGHGVGGAVALTASLLLLNRGFDLTNVITFGALKSLHGGTLERYLQRVNPIRVVLQGDPVVDFPVSGAEGRPFVHVGELLLLSPRTSPTTSSTPPDSPSLRVNSSNKQCAMSSSTNFPFAVRHTTMSETDCDEIVKEDTRTEEDQEGFSGMPEIRIAYRSRYLLEHYVEHLSNAQVPLSYAEKGDENWDDGDYLAPKQRCGTE